jgi:hypothetical protein
MAFHPAGQFACGVRGAPDAIGEIDFPGVNRRNTQEPVENVEELGLRFLLWPWSVGHFDA